VYHEGLGDESAYYTDGELINEINADFTGDGSLNAINKASTSPELQKRVQAAVAKAAQSVLTESLPNSLLASDAANAQDVVVVANGSLFWVGKNVIISDSQHSESNTIAAVSVNTLTMSSNLQHSYTVANGGVVTFVNNNERLKWAAGALLNPDQYTLAMTSFVAQNSTVQTNGNASTDVQVQTVVNSFVSKLAAASTLA
jgi:hypothetical protein